MLVPAWQEYMKENLGKTKENHPRAPHHEIMAILKEQYHQNKTDGKAPSRTSSTEPIWIDDWLVDCLIETKTETKKPPKPEAAKQR